jgi:hypothetical protein
MRLAASGIKYRAFSVPYFNVLAMGLNPSPSGETFRFFVLLEFGDGEVPNEFAQPL